MSLLLNIRVLIALAIVAALGFSHFTVYRAGKNDVRKEWLAATAAANIEASRFERKRQQGVDEAGVAAARRNNGIAADLRANRAVASGLRADLDAAERLAAQSAAAADQLRASQRELLAESAELLTEIAGAADAHASDVKTLRDAWPR